MTDDTDHATQYENRNEAMREIIDTLAAHEPSELAEWGTKAELARELDVGEGRIHYILNEWPELVEWRRAANRDPVDGDAVKEAYDDEALQTMAEQTAVADGMGNVRVNVEWTLDEAFRAIKLLPNDLGMKVFTQVIEADDLPKEGLEALFDDV